MELKGKMATRRGRLPRHKLQQQQHQADLGARDACGASLPSYNQQVFPHLYCGCDDGRGAGGGQPSWW